MTSLIRLSLFVGLSLAASSTFAQTDWPDRKTLPDPLEPFKGQISEYYTDSKSHWQSPVMAPEGAPNVVVILLDDVGFGQTGTFGGTIPTPEMDKLAAEGLKFTRFHTTAICGPTRAALLTGRNHHVAGNGFLMEWATGFPSYSTMIPRNTATIGKILSDNGYSTWWFGKNHNTPDWETTVAGPFDRWPTGLGFDYFYGFNQGETDQYYPVLFENTEPVEPDKSPQEGYHFMTDMTDRAIARMKFAKSVAPEKPFFMYFAPGAMHAPHQAPASWREPFKGKFDTGWDAYRDEIYKNQIERGIIPKDTQLSARPDWVPQWDTLSDTQKKVYTTLMENYAGFLSFTDHEVGRLLTAVDELPDADNTMVIYIIGDNGASSEGGPDGTFNEVEALNGIQSTIEDMLPELDNVGQPGSTPHYPMGWAWAGNAPFQWVKQVASHLGGTRNPMIVKWPAKIQPANEPRQPFLHVIDIVPTVLEAAGIPMPEAVDGIDQTPLEGKSFLASFTEANFEGRDSQYFEVLSNRSIYADGWKANAQHTLPWRQDLAPGNWDKDNWELYYLPDDFSESNNLAEQNPDKLQEMKAKFDEAAKQFLVYPLDDRGAARIAVPKPGVPGAGEKSNTYTYYPGAIRITEPAGPPVRNNSWTMTAKVGPGEGKTEGVVMAFGGDAAGIVLYLEEGVPVFTYNYFGEEVVVKGAEPISADTEIVVDFAYAGGDKPGAGATITMSIDGKQVGQETMEATVPGRFGADTLGIGLDTGSPVTEAYKAPFAFTGEIGEVSFVIK